MKKYMYEVRCANSDQSPEFHRVDGMMFCNVHYLVKQEEIKERTERRCYNCNSNEWYTNKTSLTEKEYFKKLLQDPDGTIGYHVVDFDKNLYWNATSVRE